MGTQAMNVSPYRERIQRATWARACVSCSSACCRWFGSIVALNRSAILRISMSLQSGVVWWWQQLTNGYVEGNDQCSCRLCRSNFAVSYSRRDLKQLEMPCQITSRSSSRTSGSSSSVAVAFRSSNVTVEQLKGQERPQCERNVHTHTRTGSNFPKIRKEITL